MTMYDNCIECDAFVAATDVWVTRNVAEVGARYLCPCGYRWISYWDREEAAGG